MSFFDQIYQKLFPGKESTQKILLHERIERSEKYLAAYTSWKGSGAHSDLLQAIAHSYDLKKNDLQGAPDVHLLNTSTSNGFAISCHTDYTALEFQFLFDWFGEKTIQLGYLLYNSDVTLTEKGSMVETKEKHYLKPPRDLQANTLDPHFGNVLIEYIKTNDQPDYLKLIASTFPDRVYKKPENFEILAGFLFKF